MDRKNVEAIIRSMLGNPGDASKQRMKIKNVARPEDPEPTSDKSSLTRTAEIKHKIIDEQETTMDKEKRLAGLLGLSDSLIEAVKKIAKGEKDKIEPSGKTVVDTKPHTKNPDMKEDVEQVDEISGKLAHDYKKGALQSIANLALGQKQSAARDKKIVNRSTGIERADKSIEKDIAKRSAEQNKKMAREEIEQVNEIGNTPRGEKALNAVRNRASGNMMDNPRDEKAHKVEKQAETRLSAIKKNRDEANSKREYKAWKEEVEQVDELNQGVNSIMGRYSKKAADKVNSGEESPQKREVGRLLSGMKRRGGTGGIPAAKVPAVQREEVEQVDELKKSTLADYISGSSMDKSHAAHDIGQINQRAATTGTSHSDRVERDKLNKRHGNRSAGIGLAALKLSGQAKVNATEETEYLDEAGMPTSVIKHKQSLAQLSDSEIASKLGDKSEKVLRGMGWRHYGKSGQEHYVNRVAAGKKKMDEEFKLEESVIHAISDTARQPGHAKSYTHADGSKTELTPKHMAIVKHHDSLSPDKKREFTSYLHANAGNVEHFMKHGKMKEQEKSSKISLAGPKVKKPHED